MRLQPADAEAWTALDRAWSGAVERGAVRLVAPTGHVAERWRALHPDGALDIEILPHGFRPFGSEPVPVEAPSPTGEGAAPLHLVIPGQLSSGKGRELLLDALPKLAGRVRLTAVGCGQDGYRLFGRSGIDLVPAYDREDLPALIAALRPHGALLLSTVPETWSYTLSEMRALGLPVLATRVGSFVERVADGEDGVLFDPDADALVETIETLLAEPGRLQRLARNVPEQRSLRSMVADYDRRCPVAAVPDDGAALIGAVDALDRDRLAGRLARTAQRADRFERRTVILEDELARRTRWAETMERQFRERSRWAERLEAERQALDVRVQAQQRAFDEAERRHRAARNELDRRLHEAQRQRDELAGELDHLRTEREQILGSRSWRITRPLRVLNRMFGGGRLRMLANPLNWWSMGRRFVHHWRLRGLKQTLILLQSPMPDEPPPEPVGPTAVPEAGRIAEPVRWTAPETPRISVIIPVYNQLHFTAACLHSVVHARNEVPFEVIVIDDASSDGTARWLKRCTGIRWMSNPENLGFIGTCNRGAAEAKGEFLVFLNNDTEVRDGWLDALLSVFETHPDAGIVGGRLVFADGTLQEAGGLVFDDGSGWNYGRGDDPGRPQYGFVAECDYVSGACLAIERARFQALGGFDTHYAPAYYEDTDLCFKVRAQGLKVYVQPAATIVHFEGATSGTDVDAESGTKRYQKINREKFLERWADALAEQPPNAPDFERADPVAQLRHHRLPRRALVIDATTPMPDHDSGSVRMFALLKLLVELGYRTRFLPDNRSWAGRHSEALQQAGIEVLSAPWVTELEDWLAEYGSELDLVLVSRHYVLTPVLKLIRTYCPQAKLVFDTVDLHFLREEREAELAGTAAARRAAARTRQQELDLVAEADATLVVSAFERDLLAELAPDAEVHIVSNIHSLHDPGRPFDERADLLFVGGFQHPPNLDAAQWLIDEILPRVREQLPDVELHLIGSKMPESLSRRQAAGLRVHGFVADLDPFLAGCRVSVAPLRYGAGVKGKVNQAMSHGLPVVATSCAAEGMFTTHGEDILMADDADAFAAEVVRVYRDEALWRRLAEGGRENVERYFSVAAARRALEGLLGVK
nr:glycosyltransferase [Wenzhouxiangella sp. XN79A]